MRIFLLQCCVRVRLCICLSIRASISFCQLAKLFSNDIRTPNASHFTHNFHYFRSKRRLLKITFVWCSRHWRAFCNNKETGTHIHRVGETEQIIFERDFHKLCNARGTLRGEREHILPHCRSNATQWAISIFINNNVTSSVTRKRVLPFNCRLDTLHFQMHFHSRRLCLHRMYWMAFRLDFLSFVFLHLSTFFLSFCVSRHSTTSHIQIGEYPHKNGRDSLEPRELWEIGP